MISTRTDANWTSWGVNLAFGLTLLFSTAWAADAPPSSAVAPSAASPTSMEELAGQAFTTRCAACHAKGDLTPLPNQLKKLSPKEIYAALRHGVMQEYALGLDDGTMHALAQFLGDPDAERKRPANGGATLCSGKQSIGKSVPAWPGWSLDTSNARYVARSLSTAEVQGLRLKWAFVFPDTQAFKGAANPLAVVDGRVYVGSLNTWVYALDAQSGCAYWTFEAEGRVRSNVAVAEEIVTFADLLANVYALDAHTGKELWRQRAEIQSTARITGSVTIHNGQVYVPVSAIQEALMRPDLSCCTFNGSVVAYELKT